MARLDKHIGQILFELEFEFLIHHLDSLTALLKNRMLLLAFISNKDLVPLAM